MPIRSNFTNLEEARKLARRRLPRVAFDYVDGGADDEITLRRNREAFEDLELVPRFLEADRVPALDVRVAGTELKLPVVIGSTGLSGVVRPDADLAGARAAAAEGTAFALATLGNVSLEDTAAASPTPPWFQLYAWNDRQAVGDLLDRAAAVGCRVILLTVDCPDIGNRERDTRNGFALPPKPRWRTAADAIRHPVWSAGMLRGFDFPNLRDVDASPPRGLLSSFRAAQLANERLYDCRVTPDDLAWVRERWDGTLVVKGVLSSRDAIAAADLGAEAVVVSNHGGRQLDGTIPSIVALPEIAAAVGGRMDVLIDSGVRRGSDVVKALALGADACLLGRPWLFGLAAGGEQGVRRVLQLLRTEIERTLVLLGVPSLGALDRSWIHDGRSATGS